MHVPYTDRSKGASHISQHNGRKGSEQPLCANATPRNHAQRLTSQNTLPSHFIQRNRGARNNTECSNNGGRNKKPGRNKVFIQDVCSLNSSDEDQEEDQDDPSPKHLRLPDNPSVASAATRVGAAPNSGASSAKGFRTFVKSPTVKLQHNIIGKKRRSDLSVTSTAQSQTPRKIFKQNTISVKNSTTTLNNLLSADRKGDVGTRKTWWMRDNKEKPRVSKIPVRKPNVNFVRRANFNTHLFEFSGNYFQICLYFLIDVCNKGLVEMFLKENHLDQKNLGFKSEDLSKELKWMQKTLRTKTYVFNF